MDTLIFFVGLWVIGILILIYLLLFDRPKHQEHKQ